MKPQEEITARDSADYAEPCDRVEHDVGLSRRGFVHVLGAGLLVSVSLPMPTSRKARISPAHSARPCLRASR